MKIPTNAFVSSLKPLRICATKAASWTPRPDKTLLSFIASSVLVSASPSPITIPGAVENSAWALFLPSSLFLSIVGNESMTETENPSGNGLQLQMTMLIAFTFGVIGSIIGGYCSYYVATYLSHWRNNQRNFSVSTACLTASYIGGTANFFESARSLLATPSGTCSNDLVFLHQLAGADIGVMILYFATLNLVKHLSGANFHLPVENEKVATSIVNMGYPECLSSTDRKSGNVLRTLLRLSSLMLSILFAIGTSKIQSSLVKVPGVSVMLLTLAAGGFVKLLSTWKAAQPARRLGDLCPVSEVQGAASDTSTLLLCAFYCVLGLKSRVQDIIRLGIPVLGLFGTILGVHLGVSLSCAYLWNRLVSDLSQLSFLQKLYRSAFCAGSNRGELRDDAKRLLVDIDTVLIASNACVGGAATAASMAGGSATEHQEKNGATTHSFNRPELMLPASVVGIIGYLIGTPIGLHISTVLR